MRVAQVVADGRPGGGTTMVMGLVEALSRGDSEPALVTDRGSEAAALGRRSGARVEEVDFFSPASATREVAAALRRLAPDVVHAHGSRAGFHSAGALSDSRVRDSVRRAVYTVHGYHFQHRPWPRRWLGARLERRASRAYATVVHVCHYDRRLAERHRLVPAASVATVIHNGVDVDALERFSLEGHQGERLARAAFVGRLVPQKDPSLVAEIADRLADRDLASVIVGGGPLESEVRERLEGRLTAGSVKMTGETDRRTALAELASSSVLVLPSKWEGLPVVVLEAMALGVPVVAAGVGGVPEALGSDAGVLVEGREPGGYVDAAARLLSDPAQAEALARRANARVREHFDLSTCLERTLALYR